MVSKQPNERERARERERFHLVEYIEYPIRQEKMVCFYNADKVIVENSFYKPFLLSLFIGTENAGS